MIKEDEILKKRINELAVKSYNNSQFVFTDFLSPSEISLILENEQEIDFVPHFFYGGSEQCERKILKFGSEEEFGYDEEFPIKCIMVEPLMKKFADNLNHRDFLGAIMNLGIDRSVIGDIFIRDKVGYVFCTDKIADYLMDNLDKIKHTNVKCKIVQNDTDELKPELRDMELIVSSVRTDGIISKLYNLSRKQSIEYFSEHKVFINGRVTESNSKTLKNGDIVSVRGHGKFIFNGIANETKKGRLKIYIKLYI